MIPIQFDLFGIFSNLNAFMVLFIIIGAMAGMISRKLSVSAFGAILVFAHVVINTDLFIFNAILYLVLFIILLWASSFVVSGYFGAETEGE